MLDTLLLLKSLENAQKIIVSARIDCAGASMVVWEKLNNARTYLDKQVAALLADN